MTHPELLLSIADAAERTAKKQSDRASNPKLSHEAYVRFTANQRLCEDFAASLREIAAEQVKK